MGDLLQPHEVKYILDKRKFTPIRELDEATYLIVNKGPTTEVEVQRTDMLNTEEREYLIDPDEPFTFFNEPGEAWTLSLG
jgi:hypothetical protein